MVSSISTRWNERGVLPWTLKPWWMISSHLDVFKIRPRSSPSLVILETPSAIRFPVHLVITHPRSQGWGYLQATEVTDRLCYRRAVVLTDPPVGGPLGKRPKRTMKQDGRINQSIIFYLPTWRVTYNDFVSISTHVAGYQKSCRARSSWSPIVTIWNNMNAYCANLSCTHPHAHTQNKIK